MKTVTIKAGDKTRIIHRQFSSLTTIYSFEATPTMQDGYLAGTIVVKGSDWIFSKPSKTMPLQACNTATAGIWDTFFSVYVIPEVDVVITLPSKRLRYLPWLILLVGIVIGVAIALILLTSG
ncbi:MAG: hypothetical protein ACFCU8_01905 [Thermosynechococcaceae cyanobacterium]